MLRILHFRCSYIRLLTLIPTLCRSTSMSICVCVCLLRLLRCQSFVKSNRGTVFCLYGQSTNRHKIYCLTLAHKFRNTAEDTEAINLYSIRKKNFCTFFTSSSDYTLLAENLLPVSCIEGPSRANVSSEYLVEN